MDTFDLERVGSYLEDHPDSEVIIIANTRMTADVYWRRIQDNLQIKKRAWIVTNNDYSMDGMPIVNSLVLKIGRWWENKNAKEFMDLARVAKVILPITFIPPFTSVGGDNDN